MPGFWQKKNIDKQKVQVADEIKRDIWKYLVSSNVTRNAWYNYVYNISSCAKINTHLLVLYARNEKKRYIDNQKVQD